MLSSFCTLSHLPVRSDISPASSTNDGTGDETAGYRPCEGSEDEALPRHQIPHSNNNNRGAGVGRGRGRGK